MQAYEFNSTIDNGMIHIPEKYIRKIPKFVRVTLVPLNNPNIKLGVKSKVGELTPDNFSALKIDTHDWKFNREEANERR